MCPRLAAVGGFVNAIAGREIRPTQPFSAADINDVRIGWGKRERSDGACRLPIEDRRPCATEIVGLPNAAAVRRHEEHIRLVRNAGDRLCASGAERANAAPAQFLIWN